MPGCGVVAVQLPLFRCGEGPRLAGGRNLPGAEERGRRYSKNRRVSPETGRQGIELRGGLRVGERGAFMPRLYTPEYPRPYTSVAPGGAGGRSNSSSQLPSGSCI